jgi:mono/diheme cytochrome c family protein
MRSRRFARSAPFLVAATLLVAGLGAQPSRAEPPPGETLYRRYCASCHGVLGDGTGPVAPSLALRPSDLTRLAERHGWPLPKELLARYIDGREQVPAHGSREMPVWGRRLYEGVQPGPGLEGAKAVVIWAILDYLETIQGAHVSDAAQR